MPYTMEDFQKDYVRNHLDVLSSQEVVSRFSVEERLEGLSLEECLKGLSSQEVVSRFSLEERLEGFSAEEIQAYLKQLKKPSKP